VTKVLGDKLAAAAARKYQADYRVRQRQDWANKAAELDIGIIRQIDRVRFGGILPPEFPPRPAGGWFRPQLLWECPDATRHAPLCDCDAFVNGHSVNPASRV